MGCLGLSFIIFLLHLLLDNRLRVCVCVCAIYCKRLSLCEKQLKMFSNWIRFYLKYYSLFGFHSIDSARIGGKLTTTFIFIIQLVLGIWCMLWAFQAFEMEKRNIEYLDALNFFLFYLTTSVAYWPIIYDTYKNRRNQNAFWQRFNRINNGFIIHINADKWDFLGAFIALGVIDLILFVLTIVRALSNHLELVFHYIFIIVFDQRIIFYLFHLKTVTFQMRKILHIVNNQRYANTIMFRDYELIYEMIDDMNETFGWSNLGLILLNFHTSVTFASFIYSQKHHSFYQFNTGSFFFLTCILFGCT